MMDEQEEINLGGADALSAQYGEKTESANVRPMRKPGFGEKLLPFLIMAFILTLDQVTKYLVETRIPLYGY